MVSKSIKSIAHKVMVVLMVTGIILSTNGNNLTYANDYSNAVVERYNTSRAVSAWVIRVSIPEITLQGSAFQSVNDEIWEKYYLEYYDDKTETYTPRMQMSYSWTVQKNVLSLVCKKSHVDAPGDFYDVYNLDIYNGKKLDITGFLHQAGISETEYYSRVKETLEAYFKENNSWAQLESNSRFLESYNKQYYKTLDPSNIAEAIPFFDEEGNISIIGKVYSLIQSDYYYRVLKLATNSESITPVTKSHMLTPLSTRFWGNNRYDTSFAVANELYRLTGKFENIVVAYGGNYPDALSGGYLAKAKNAPLLLINTKQEARTTAYIKAYMKTGGTVYLLGGSSVISDKYEQSLRNEGINVSRLAGRTAIDTNLAILNNCTKSTDELLVATASNFADSLSGSAVGKPMLLTRGGALTQEQLAWLKASGIKKFYILGGAGAVSEKIATELSKYGKVERVAGSNRYATSDAIARRFFTNPDTITLATGKNYADGLSGAPLALHYKSPIFLVGDGTWGFANNYVKTKTISKSISIGGTSAVSLNTVNNIMTNNNPITGYSVNREDYSKNVNNRDFFMFFDVVTITGNKDKVRSINRLIEEKKANYIKRIVDKHSDVSTFANASSYWAAHKYEPRELKSVFLDEQYISIGWHCYWYAGGVSNYIWDAINYDVKSEKEITIYDILGDNAVDRIRKAIPPTYPEWSWSDAFNKYDFNKLKFYFDEENVYVAFASYELNQGTGGILLEIKR